MTARQTLVPVLLALLSLAVAALPDPQGAANGAMQALALTLFTIGLWATGAIGEHLTALIFFVLAMIFAIAPPAVVFSGFASTAFWLVLGGMIMGTAADHTGLGRYLGAIVMRRVGGSYPRLIAGIVIGAGAVSFLIPTAMGRMMLLMPIVLGLADRIGFEKGSNGRRGMVLALTLGCIFLPLTVLPANVPNAILAGAADAIPGVSITYGTYLLMNFPINGVLKSAVMIALILLLFPAKTPEGAVLDEAPEPLGPEARRLALILAVTLAVWASDFLHGISPGWVAAASGVVCLLPGIGVLPSDKFRAAMNVEVLLYVAAVLGLGNMIASTGAGNIAADRLLAYADFSPESPAWTYAAFSGTAIIMQLFATLPGTIVVLTPFTPDIAAASGLPVLTVLMMLVNGFTTVFFPYQTAPILVGIRIGGIAIADGIRVMVPLAIISILTLLPLNYFWWRLLGYMP